ncbi:MAG: histidine triad nucleotide-binding protein [Gallicola sp.]|nr:histidine triad nucleotide-binding protein [Gallicola sp.]
MNCIFCEIVKGNIETDAIYEDDKIIAFNDQNPQAPVHFLVIPKEHISSANEINSANASIIGDIYAAVAKLAKEMGFAEDGYRIVNNCGNDGGQTVHHIHFHVLAGRSLQWPPG